MIFFEGKVYWRCIEFVVFKLNLIHEVLAMTRPLEPELLTYQAHQSELLAKARGKFVLIKNDQIVALFDTSKDALREGYQRFGVVPMLVKEIREVEAPLFFTSRLIGV